MYLLFLKLTAWSDGCRWLCNIRRDCIHPEYAGAPAGHSNADRGTNCALWRRWRQARGFHNTHAENGDFLINYYGPPSTFTYISAADILSGKTYAEELQNKIVLVGGTAAGIHDIHTTPYGTLFPCTEIQATLIENILQRDFLIRPDWLILLDVAMIIGSGLILGASSLFFGALVTTLFVLAGAGGYLAVDFYIFSRMGLWVNTVYPVFTQLFVYTGTTLWKYLYEEKQRRFIQKAFAKYLSPVM